MKNIVSQYSRPYVEAPHEYERRCKDWTFRDWANSLSSHKSTDAEIQEEIKRIKKFQKWQAIKMNAPLVLIFLFFTFLAIVSYLIGGIAAILITIPTLLFVYLLIILTICQK